MIMNKWPYTVTINDENQRQWPYTVTFKADHPSRSRSGLAIQRWRWLHDNIGELGQAWNWMVPFVLTEDLVFYFGTPEDRTLFVLTWG